MQENAEKDADESKDRRQYLCATINTGNRETEPKGIKTKIFKFFWNTPLEHTVRVQTGTAL